MKVDTAGNLGKKDCEGDKTEERSIVEFAVADVVLGAFVDNDPVVELAVVLEGGTGFVSARDR